MSHANTAFSFNTPRSMMNHDQLHLPMPRLSESPPPVQQQQSSSPFGSNMAASQPFDDAAPPLSSTSAINPLMIDNLAKDFQLEPVQCANLHAFVQIGSADGTLSKSDLGTRLYSLAALYADIAERHRLQRDQGSMDLKGVFNDLKVRLEGQFEFTKDQMGNIRKAANDLIYQPTRINFVTMNVDLMKYIRERHASMGLSNVIGNPARERVLASVLKKTCSSVRNAFRQDIRDSIIGDNPCSLADFTYHTANKYRHGQFDENMGFGYTVHNVILRHFGLNNIELIKKVSAPIGDNGEESDSTPPAPKRKRAQVGRIPKGEDFWGRVDTFFAEMVTKFGRNLTGTRWTECVNDMIRRDNAQFLPQAEDPSTSQQIIAQGAVLASAFSGF